MPLYEYECDSCGHRFEVIQKFSDALVDTCPSCGKKSVHKLISSPAIQFKGSGWYITDYAKKDSTSATKAGNAKEGSTSSSEGSGSTTESSASTPAAAAPATPTKKSE